MFGVRKQNEKSLSFSSFCLLSSTTNPTTFPPLLPVFSPAASQFQALLCWLGCKSASEGLNKILLVVHTPSFKKNPTGLRKKFDSHFLSLNCLEAAVPSGKKKIKKACRNPPSQPLNNKTNKQKVFSLKSRGWWKGRLEPV